MRSAGELWVDRRDDLDVEAAVGRGSAKDLFASFDAGATADVFENLVDVRMASARQHLLKSSKLLNSSKSQPNRYAEYQAECARMLSQTHFARIPIANGYDKPDKAL